MGDRRCCCPVTCVIGEDDFTGTDGDPPSLAKWAVLSGDFEIDSNTLHTVTPGVCVTLLRQPAPARPGKGYNTRIQLDLLNFPASGTKDWGVICGFTSVSNFDYIKFVYDASTGEMTPEFYQSGTKVMDITSYPAGEAWSISPSTASFSVVICYADTEWSVTHGDEESGQGDVMWVMCGGGQPVLPTTYGMAGFTEGDFDNWYYEIHWESLAICEYCSCFCRNESDIEDYLCLPETLYLVLDPDTGYTCTELDGLELELYQSYPDVTGASPVYDASPHKKWWYSETFMVESEKVWFVLSCESGVFRMACLTYPDLGVVGAQANNLRFGTISTPSTTGEWQNMDDSVCDPLELVFENLRPDYTTCNILDDDGNIIGTGERPRGCSAGDCWEYGYGTDVSWTVTVTE